MRWDDGVEYIEQIIGFLYGRRRYCLGKSGQLTLMWISQSHVKIWVRPDVVYKARFREKSLSSNKKETVPQTDTGDQVEQTKTNE